MEKKNLKANNFDIENEIKKVQGEYIEEIKTDNGIIDVSDQIIDESINLELLAKEKNKQESDRLKELKKIKKGDRINYFMIDLDDRLREISFKFPPTKLIIELSEYGISSDGRLFLDLTKAVDLLMKNNLFISKFDIDDFYQDEIEGFGGFLISLLRNPRKFIQDLSKW